MQWKKLIWFCGHAVQSIILATLASSELIAHNPIALNASKLSRAVSPTSLFSLLVLLLTLMLCRDLVRNQTCVMKSVPAAVETAASVQTFMLRESRAIRGSSQIRARCPQAICTSHSIIHWAANITQTVLCCGLWIAHVVFYNNPMENELSY